MKRRQFMLGVAGAGACMALPTLGVASAPKPLGVKYAFLSQVPFQVDNFFGKPLVLTSNLVIKKSENLFKIIILDGRMPQIEASLALDKVVDAVRYCPTRFSVPTFASLYYPTLKYDPDKHEEVELRLNVDGQDLTVTHGDEPGLANTGRIPLRYLRFLKV